MAEVIVFPDAVEATLAELRTEAADRSDSVLTGVTFGATVKPGDSPTRFVWVRRFGGPSDLILDAARLDFVTWHDTPHDAMGLAQLVRAIVKSRRGLTIAGIGVAEIDDVLGPSTVPDPANPAREVVMHSLQVEFRGSAVDPSGHGLADYGLGAYGSGPYGA